MSIILVGENGCLGARVDQSYKTYKSLARLAKSLKNLARNVCIQYHSSKFVPNIQNHLHVFFHMLNKFQ